MDRQRSEKPGRRSGSYPKNNLRLATGDNHKAEPVKPKPHFTWSQLDSLRTELRLSNDLPPGAFTVMEYKDKYHIARDVAYRQIKKMVDAGKVQSETRTINGRITRIYWL